MFHSIDEAAMVDITVGPDEDAILIFWFVVDEFAYKDISIDIFHTIAIFTIILELSLVESKKTIFIDKESSSMIEIITSFSKIQHIGTFA